MLTNHTPDTLIEKLPALSSLPDVITELEEALEAGSASMEELGEIIKKDTDLTARLLKIGNSSFYGFPKGVQNVAEALSLIGLQQVKQLLTGSAVLEYFDAIPPKAVNMRSFWEHSVACGIAAKVIAVQRRAPDPEMYFVAGLIHDIGRLVIYLRIPDETLEMLKMYDANDDKPLYEYEKENLGFDHGEIAAALLKQWDFPKSFIQSVHYHHAPQLADVYAIQTAVLNIADFIVHTLDIGSSGEHVIPPFSERAWKRLELPIESLATTIKETEKQSKDALSLFL